MNRRGAEPDRREIYFRRTVDAQKRYPRFWRHLNRRYEVKVDDEPVVIMDASALIHLLNGHTTDMSDNMRWATERYDAGDRTTWIWYPTGPMAPGYRPPGVDS